MISKLNILGNTLEGMMADAEDKGKDHIAPVLTAADVGAILHGLHLLEHSTPAPKVDLAATAEMMTSPDYKQRFVAEYVQTKIRYDKLHAMLVKADAGTLEFTPTCPLDLLKEQAAHMGRYLYCLEVRAQIEDVTLPED